MSDGAYSLYGSMSHFALADAKATFEQADVVMTGVPFDLATSGRPGARFAPAALRNISSNLGWESKRYPWQFNLREYLTVHDSGDIAFPHGDSKACLDGLEAQIDKICAAGKIPVSMGGDHLVSLPIFRALARHHGPFCVIHFDAHSDDYHNGTIFDHGSMFHHGKVEGLFAENGVIQLGIRTEFPEDTPFNVIHADKLAKLSVDEIVATIKNQIGDRKVYLTFDIDALDPAFAPGTGTPVAGGLTSHTALQIIRKLDGLNWIGMDVVEVSPPYDHAGMTAVAGAYLLCDMLHLCAIKKHPELAGQVRG